MNPPLPTASVETLRTLFADDLREHEPLARYTSARIGGPADLMIVVRSTAKLSEAAQVLWDLDVPFKVIGGGSNVLVADAGVRGVVVLNQAVDVRFWESEGGPRVQAESGASLGSIARRAVERGWSGLEWAATVPGTVGGAVVGNAGAHGGDMAGSLEVAEILQREMQVETWPVSRLNYAYRDSWLKRNPDQAVVLSATLRLVIATPEEAKAEMRAFIEHRQRTQPPGASMGSMFKNPPGDYAGRLIDEAGLKGFRSGAAQISELHGNFFINVGDATAADVWNLIKTARARVLEKFDIELDLEVELIGDWDQVHTNRTRQMEKGPS
jgi:UDP-N-acetylmuramate dehydrogenase